MPPLTSESESESVLGPGGGRENGDRAEPEKADGEGPAGEAAGASARKNEKPRAAFRRLPRPAGFVAPRVEKSAVYKLPLYVGSLD